MGGRKLEERERGKGGRGGGGSEEWEGSRGGGGGGGRLQRKIEDKGALKALQPCQQGGRNRPTMRFEE